METKTILHQLRTKAGLSQDALAEKVFVTRQAVSRWETGETVPNTETLKLLSGIFGVSINTLLGSPEKLVCQCCGMPLEDGIMSREKDGSINEKFCQWCYADGVHMYSDMDQLIEVCVRNMAGPEHSEEEVREYLRSVLPQLDYWKNRGGSDGNEMDELKMALISEINSLDIPGMPEVESLIDLVGRHINLEYVLPGGVRAKFLDDDATYLGTQLETGGRYFGIAAGPEFILVSAYGENCADPELLLFRKR